MKFLELLFSKNKRGWKSFLNDIETPFDRYSISKWHQIVDNFLIKHNIDFDKYSANAKWDNDSLSIDQEKMRSINVQTLLDYIILNQLKEN